MMMSSAGCSASFAALRFASATMPENIVTAMTPSISRVVAALRLLGCRNAGTPLLIASTPVRAAQPEEKARRTRKASATAVSPLTSGRIS
jgi:hypothetical protein